MDNLTNSITFSRETFLEFKNKYLNAKAEGDNSFVHKGNLVYIDRANILIQMFDSKFIDSNVATATIEYPRPGFRKQKIENL
jgi:hypothetical protein